MKAMVGHSARLLRGARLDEECQSTAANSARCRFMNPTFQRTRLATDADTGAGNRDKAPGGPLSQLATQLFDSLIYAGRRRSRSVYVGRIRSSRRLAAEVDISQWIPLRFKERGARLCRLLLDLAR